MLSSTVISILFRAIKALHRKKDAAYGFSWKRRGELVSIVANIARKVDRVEEFTSKGTELSEESILDTAIDLFVYVTKYRLFLFERCPDAVKLMPDIAPKPYSDYVENFDRLIDQSAITECKDIETNISAKIITVFEELFKAASSEYAPSERLRIASTLSELAVEYIFQIIIADPQCLERFVNNPEYGT